MPSMTTLPKGASVEKLVAALVDGDEIRHGYTFSEDLVEGAEIEPSLQKNLGLFDGRGLTATRERFLQRCFVERDLPVVPSRERCKGASVVISCREATGPQVCRRTPRYRKMIHGL
jgi:hypothetical protein